MLKKTLAIAALVALSAGTAMAAFQNAQNTVPQQGVVNSVHDMRNYNGTTDVTTAGIDQQRVCAFCHTPHHALPSTTGGAQNLDYNPLWSHQVNSNTFIPYYSTTLNSYAINEPDILVGPSRLCMSCHDGTIALDTHYNNGANGFKLTGDDFNQPGVGAGPLAAGSTLENDHPIGFDYNQVAGAVGPDQPGITSGVTDGYINQPTEFFKGRAALSLTPITIGERLYVPTTNPSAAIMTCATCHDVHNRKNGDDPALGLNYLVMAPQANSALCVSCHIK